MDPKSVYYENTANAIIKALNKRRMAGYFCHTKEEAVALANDLVASDSSVSFGGSMTLADSGMLDTLRNRKDLTLFDRSQASTPEEISEIYHKALSCDYYFMSTNALTLDGELVNIDGTGNRVAALIYGPENVIILAGMNKVSPTVEEAISRVHNIASPPNCIRLDRKTPCSLTGKCGDCLGDASICSQTVITRRSGIVDRIKVILIGEELGY